MSDRKQTNKYYPPDYDPRKGSLNTQLGQHPLRKRANRIDEGILVVRFEMPFNVWCLGCGGHIGKGVRYNAQKSQVPGSELSPGMDGPYPAAEGYASVNGGLQYFSTKLWQFRMTCHMCSAVMVVRTSPKDAQYIMHSGVRGKDESFSAADNQTLELLSSEERARVRTDALFATEHGEKDKNAAAREHARLGALFARNEAQRGGAGGDFLANARLRAALRTDKKTEAAAVAAGAARGIDMALLPTTVEDERRSDMVHFQPPRGKLAQQQELKRLKLREGDIFQGVHARSASAAAAAGSSSSAVVPAVSSSSSYTAAAAAAAPTARARAIQLALATGINVRALAPLPSAPASASSSRAGAATPMPLMRLAAKKEPGAPPQSHAEASPAAAAAVAGAPHPTPPSNAEQRKRKRAAAEPEPDPPSAAAGGLLGLAAYDSEPD